MGDIYRPTVRMDDAYRQYIDQVFHASSLDRNQIIRLMLFTAPLSAVFMGMLRGQLLPGIDAPASPWTRKDSALWQQQTWDEGRGVNNETADTLGGAIHVVVG